MKRWLRKNSTVSRGLRTRGNTLPLSAIAATNCGFTGQQVQVDQLKFRAVS